MSKVWGFFNGTIIQVARLQTSQVLSFPFLLNRTGVGTLHQFHKTLPVTKCGIFYLFVSKKKKKIGSLYFPYLLSERKILSSATLK